MRTAILLLGSALALLSSCKGREAAPVGADSAKADSSAHAAWRCPMHPQIVSDHPGTCPLCGMELVPFRPDATYTTDSVPREDLREVRMDPGTVQRIGVRAVAARAGSLSPELRVDAVGVLDEAATRSVTVRSMGYVEQVAPLREGDRVRAGQVLARFYGPDLVAAQQEWLQAARAGDSQAVRAARERLRTLDLPESALREAQGKDAPVREVPVVSPADGWILRRSAVQGQSAMAGQELFRIQEGSGVLLEARVPQSRLQGLSAGTPAEVRGAGLERTVRSRIRAVLPELDPSDRTAKVRLECPPGSGLRAGGVYQAELRPASETGVLVPEGAILRTGRRDIAFLALGGGRFRPVGVSTGATADGTTLVRSGLSEGDRVVVAARFLVDGESRLEATAAPTGAGPAKGAAR